MISVTSLCMVGAGLALISPEARATMTEAIGDPAGVFGRMVTRAASFAHMFAGMAGDYRADNLPVVGFALVAVVLTGMMFRA